MQERNGKKYSESISDFGRKESKIHLSGKINLHTSPSLVGSGKKGKQPGENINGSLDEPEEARTGSAHRAREGCTAL